MSKGHHTYWNDEAQIAYVVHGENQTPDADEEAQRDEELLRAVIRAIRRSPKLHAELVIALEHKV
ncbi:MAG: hypothetical protein RL199_71 [Pseudomonadota bacterium]